MRIEKNLRFVIIALIILIIFIIVFFQFVVPKVIEQDQRIKGPFKYGSLIQPQNCHWVPLKADQPSGNFS